MSDLEKELCAGEERERKYGIDSMRESADRSLKKNSDLIVKGLLDRSIKGEVSPAKYLCALAGDSKELSLALERKFKPKRSLATEWANEPEWTGEDDMGAVRAWAAKLGRQA
jgi:hypothetical protein